LRWRIDRARREEVDAYMKPAPPVIMIFLTSGRGSNFVEPMRTGALFQTLLSSKKDPSVAAMMEVRMVQIKTRNVACCSGDRDSNEGKE
jgi:hypothetical protein